MKYKLIHPSLNSLINLYIYIFKKLDKRYLLKVTCFTFLFLGLAIFISLKKQVIPFETWVELGLVFLGLATVIPVYWLLYYLNNKDKEVEFFENFFTINDKKIFYSEIRVIEKQGSSNFAITIFSFPFDFKFVGHPEDVFDLIVAKIKKVQIINVRYKR